MDLLAISPEGHYDDEAGMIEALLAAGLTRYHLRKPSDSPAQVAAVLVQLPPTCRSRIVVHQHPEQVQHFGLGGYHFKDRPQATAERDIWRGQGFAHSTTLSRSLHAIDDLATACARWDYVFISPVFASISKANYRPAWSEAALHTALRASRGVSKRYALGGVKADNFSRCADLGFDGIVLHGALWRAGKPLEELKKYA